MFAPAAVIATFEKLYQIDDSESLSKVPSIDLNKHQHELWCPCLHLGLEIVVTFSMVRGSGVVDKLGTKLENLHSSPKPTDLSCGAVKQWNFVARHGDKKPGVVLDCQNGDRFKRLYVSQTTTMGTAVV